MDNSAIEWPLESELEEQYLQTALKNRRWWSREGEFVKKFERSFSNLLAVKNVFCCTNGTDALQIALKSLDIGFLDYVIVPSITFIATALAVLKVGAYPLFADVDPETACVNLESIKDIYNKNKERTKAIILVHLGGQSCDLEPIIDWAKKENIVIIEDCAQALGTIYKNKHVGGFGDIGCFSFQNSKNISSGEGGAIVTNNNKLSIKINKYLDFNCDYSSQDTEFKYLSGNSRLSEFQGAVLLGQLRKFRELNAKREINYQYLLNAFSNIPGVIPVIKPAYITHHGCHFFMFRYKKEEFNLKSKMEFINYLKSHGFSCFGGYDHIPLDRFPYFRENLFLRYDPLWSRLYTVINFPIPEGTDCLNSFSLASEFVWLPQFVLLRNIESLKNITSAIENFRRDTKNDSE